MSKKLLIFDLDGTIADTLGTIYEAVNMCMHHFGFPELDADSVRKNVGNGVSALIKGCVPFDVRENEERCDEVTEYFRGCYKLTHDNIDGCYDGLGGVIYELRSRGYSLAVLSNKPDELVKGIIKKLFEEGLFSVAQGQTELPRKPSPIVPLMIADSLGYEAEDVYYIGDSEVDILTAKNAKMHSVAVSWGFREREMLVASAPEFIVDKPEQLLELFN